MLFPLLLAVFRVFFPEKDQNRGLTIQYFITWSLGVVQKRRHGLRREGVKDFVMAVPSLSSNESRDDWAGGGGKKLFEIA